MAYQVELPPHYYQMTPEELDEGIAADKAALGERLVILGHHYQRDEVIKFADYRGDSFRLAQSAATHPEADYIVFCGVHFMAESADVLSAEHQKVVLPDLNAGCSMADMARDADVENCWEVMHEVCGDGGFLPVTYMNSSAYLKAFCGRNGGAVCTSSNARTIFQWAFDQDRRILFFPDEHLGRNTAVRFGIPLENVVVWDPNPMKDLGGLAEEQLKDATIILWKGYCSVHQQFGPQHVRMVRERCPEIRVIVHPECSKDVVDLADDIGSTEQIIKAVSSSPPGSQWAVGTEIHLVNRLAAEHPDKLILNLNPFACVCTTMYRVDAQHLCWALDNLLEGTVVNQIIVPEAIAHWARIALDRMLQIA